MEILNELTRTGITELGILDPVNPQILYDAMGQWIPSSKPQNPRTIWFLKSDSLNLTPPSLYKSRWIPMDKEKHRAWSHTGPFQALLVSKDSTPLKERGFAWMKAYSGIGEMVEGPTIGNWILWTWVSLAPLKRALMICHHCGVLPDLRRELWFQGIRGEFFWLSDGKAATGDAWPSTLGEFDSSVPLLRGPIGASDEIINKIKASYDMVITSHCMRYPLHFVETGLPLIHVNSTRFGNELTTNDFYFSDLKARLEKVIRSGQLRVIHNNAADKWYFEEYMKGVKQFPVIPSLCVSPLRFRIEDREKPFLIWDTRFHLTNTTDSSIMRTIRTLLGPAAKATSELSIEKRCFLDDDMLEDYRAVIHIPYNISTMSYFEQAAANIPVWIPSPAYLEKILADPAQRSELSWFCFRTEATRSGAERPDQVWDPAVIHEYVKRSDFTGFRNALFFDSVEDLLTRIHTVDYDALIKMSFMHQTRKRLDVSNGYKAADINASC